MVVERSVGQYRLLFNVWSCGIFGQAKQEAFAGERELFMKGRF